jgi:hypothetical protein
VVTGCRGWGDVASVSGFLNEVLVKHCQGKEEAQERGPDIVLYNFSCSKLYSTISLINSASCTPSGPNEIRLLFDRLLLVLFANLPSIRRPLLSSPLCNSLTL